MADAAGRTIVRVIYGGHTDWVWRVALSRDGTRLASYANDNRVLVWDATTGRCLGAYPQQRGTLMYPAFSPTGAQIVCASLFKHVRLVDIESGQALMDMSLNHGALCTTWTPDSSGVVCGCTDGIVERWAVATGERVWQTMHHTNGVTCVAIALNGQTGSSGSWDRTVQLWLPDDGQLLCTIQIGCWAWCLAFAPDGQRLASGMAHGAVAVWDVATGQSVHDLRGHTESVRQIGFTPCGRCVISAGQDDTVRIWDAFEGQLRQAYAFEPDSIRGVGLARDGTVLVATVRGTDVLLWRVLLLAGAA